jgi:hypothetical protein
METGPTTRGEHKSAGFSFSTKAVLPPSTIVNGVASACSKHLLATQRLVNTLLDLKYKVKKGNNIPLTERLWQRCLKTFNEIPIPTSVFLLTCEHSSCPPYGIVDTIHSMIQSHLQVVDRANATHRAAEAKNRIAGPHGFWRAFKPPRARPPRALRAPDGEVLTNPTDFMPAIYSYWHKI